MANYEKMYYQLFNAVSDAITLLQNAQKQGEEFFVNSTEAKIIVLDKPVKPEEDPSE